MGEPKASERRIEAVERQRKAVELRKAGMSYEAIADELGYAGKSGAYKAVSSALTRTLQEPADELRALELARLDDMLKGLWVNARKGNVYAIDRVLKIMQRRAELLGLDAPKTVKVVQEEAKRLAGEYGLTEAEILAEAEAILAGAM